MTADQAELQRAIEQVVTSKSAKKLIVAGPGAGKTTLFNSFKGNRWKQQWPVSPDVHQQLKG
jgi:GTPase SAR1 family protein